MAAWRTRRCGPSAARKSVAVHGEAGGGVGAEYSGITAGDTADGGGGGVLPEYAEGGGVARCVD